MGTVSAPSSALLAFLGAGEDVITPATALKSPTTLACVRVIAETLGTVPIHAFERTADGKSRVSPDKHPAAGLLSADANPWTGIVDLRTALLTDALLHGQAFALAIRVNGRIAELHRLEPGVVAVDETGPAGPAFQFTRNNVREVCGWNDMLWLRTPGSGTGRTVRLVHELQDAIRLDIGLQRHVNNILKRGALPSGILEGGTNLLEQGQIERLKEQFDSLYAGQSNAAKTMVLPQGLAFKQLSFSPVDLQVIETRKHAGEEIARGFKVPPTLVGAIEKATHRNVQELMRQFIQSCLMPWAAAETSAFERVLFNPDERPGHFLEHQFAELMRADTGTRFTAYRQAAGGSWLSPNEVRALENLPPIAGGEALIAQAGQGEIGGDNGQKESPNDPA